MPRALTDLIDLEFLIQDVTAYDEPEYDLEDLEDL